jgi:hypothetical protein
MEGRKERNRNEGRHHHINVTYRRTSPLVSPILSPRSLIVSLSPLLPLFPPFACCAVLQSSHFPIALSVCPVFLVLSRCTRSPLAFTVLCTRRRRRRMGKLHNTTVYYNRTNDRKNKIEQRPTHESVFLSLPCDELCIPHAVRCATHR